jgi:hypothetical protein
MGFYISLYILIASVSTNGGSTTQAHASRTTIDRDADGVEHYSLGNVCRNVDHNPPLPRRIFVS